VRFIRRKRILTVLLALALIFPALLASPAFAAGEGGVFYVDEETSGTPDDTTGGTGGTGTGSSVDPSRDGKYWVDVALWNASVNQASMGNTAFEKNPRALVVTSGGRSVIQVATTPVETSGYTTAITDVENASVI
jgi:hypothetical protein